MKIKLMAKWYWEINRLSLAMVVGILVLVNLIGGIAQIIYKNIYYNSGNDISFSITAFVMGCVLFPAGLRFGVTHGVSRKSAFVGCLVNALLFSSFCAIASGLLMLMMELMPGEAFTSIFFIIYQDYSSAIGVVSAMLLMMLWNMACVFLSMLGGLLVGGVFYRLGKIGKILWAAGLPVGLFAILPLLFAILPESFINWLLTSLSGIAVFMMASPFNMLLLILAVCAVLLIINWVLIRRAPVKAI